MDKPAHAGSGSTGACVRPVDLSIHAEEAASLIRSAFATVARAFSITPENCPTFAGFTTGEALTGRLGADGCHCLGLYHGGEMAGFVGLIPAEGRAYEITRLAVLPALRGRGYGSLLVTASAERARSLGASRIVIGIMDEHTVLKQWYRRHGFAVVTTKRFPHLPFTVCEMEMTLS